MSLERLSERLLDAAKKAGADAADCLVVDGTSTSIDVLNGSLEHAERSEGVDLGLRVFVGKSQACVSASDQSADTISQMAARAVAMAKEAPEDPFARLAHDAELFHGTDVADALDLYDPNGEPDPKLLQDAALAAEEAARAVGGVTNVQSAGAGYGQTSIHLATSNGFSNGYRRSQNSLSCVAIAGKDATMERDYYGEGRIYFSDLGTAESIGTTAGTRAVERLNPQKAPAGAFPVLFDERISSSLIGHILGATNGAAIARGSSWLRDAKDTEILPAHLSIIENPLRPRIAGSRAFDGEGLPTGRRALVDNGRLCEWTLDLATAAKLGLQTTASAMRGTSAPPSPGTSNISLTEGPQSKEDLLRDMGTGLWVTSLFGSTINPNTGDYSRGATGFWVENGIVKNAVNECTIAGNLVQMIKTMVPANDARHELSTVVPSLLVEGLTLA